MSTWEWPIDIGSSETETYRVREIKFGDGYSQLVEDGINTQERVLSITSTLLPAEFLSARDLLRTHKGVIPIDFITPLDGIPFKGIVRSWTVTHVRGTWVRLTMEVKKVFSFP